MIKTIVFGEKEEKFKASAATSILYKRLFKEEVQERLTEYSKNTKEIRKLQAELLAVRALEDSEEKQEKMQDISTKLLPLNSFVEDFVPKFAYITWLEANCTNGEVFTKLTEADFFAWLMEHESKDFTTISKDLLELWTENAKPSVKAKNQ